MHKITGILGLVLMTAPFLLQFSQNAAAFYTCFLIGAAIVFLSLIEAKRHDKDTLEYWFETVLGIAAASAPLLLGFSSHLAATATAIIIGVLLAVLAAEKVWVESRMSEI